MRLEIKNVSKSYGDNKALADFSFDFQSGIYGLLGPNGSGKSTLMNLITDCLKRDSGEILFEGKEILNKDAHFRKHIGYMPQQQGLYDEFSARRFLLYISNLKGLSKKEGKEQTEKLLKVVELSDVAHKKTGSFSGGMKQRLLLAQALLGDPKVLILDEPTTGLDPKERIRIKNYISEISTNKIILISTHVVQDIENISNTILLIKKGKLIVHGTGEELISNIEGKIYEKRFEDHQLEEYKERYKITNIRHDNEGQFVRLVSDEAPEEFEKIKLKPNLEDVCLYYFEDK